MNIIGISINHKTASVEIRETLHLSKDEIISLIQKLKKGLLTSGFVLSTCNRTEIFGFPANPKVDQEKIIDLLTSFKPVSGIKSSHFVPYFSCSAVKHIFNVAAGIESMIIGDSQILGQIKESFQIADEMKFTDPVLRRLFYTTVKVGKRSISETEIEEGAVSVSYAAVQVIEKIFANLSKKSALIIGAGETGALAGVHLKDKGIGTLTICNRTLEKAQKLASKLGADVIPFDSLQENLSDFDIIISATSAENYILHYDDIKKMMHQRKRTPCCLMDIAVPRDIDPKVSEFENVFYNDIDSLQKIVDSNIQKRRNEIPLVQSIVMEEMLNFFSWFNTLEVVPTIKTLREFFDSILTDELNKIKHKVTDEDFLKVENMTHRMIGRILHNPTIKLRELAESGDHHLDIIQRTFVLKELFKLDDFSNENENKNNQCEEENN